MPEQSYLKRAWTDLTSKKGWYKPILILGLVMCIPIIGSITTQGYLLDWAKEAAWGLNRSLTRKAGSIGRRIRYGLIAVVIYIVWLLPVMIVVALLALIPQIGFLIRIIGGILEVVVCSIASVAVLRGLVYERIEPGLQIGRILKMVAHDTKNLIAPTIAAAIAFAVVFLFNSVTDVISLSLISMFDGRSYLVGDTGLFMSTLMFFMFLGLFAYVISMILVTFLDALAMRMLGYWLVQFEPSKWGTPKDSMPFENEFAEAATNATPVSPQVTSEQAQVNNDEHPAANADANNGEHLAANVAENNDEHSQSAENVSANNSAPSQSSENPQGCSSEKEAPAQPAVSASASAASAQPAEPAQPSAPTSSAPAQPAASARPAAPASPTEPSAPAPAQTEPAEPKTKPE